MTSLVFHQLHSRGPASALISDFIERFEIDATEKHPLRDAKRLGHIDELANRSRLWYSLLSFRSAKVQ